MGLSIDGLEPVAVPQPTVVDFRPPTIQALVDHHKQYEAKRDYVNTLVENLKGMITALNRCTAQHDWQVKAFQVCLF